MHPAMDSTKEPRAFLSAVEQESRMYNESPAKRQRVDEELDALCTG